MTASATAASAPALARAAPGRFGVVLLAAGAFVLLAAAGWVFPRWLTFLLTMAAGNGLVSLGIVALMRGGVVPFGQGMVFAAGGYTAALIYNKLGFTDALGLAVWWGLNRTRQGKITLAVIHSAEIAASRGVNVSRVYMAAFSVGIFLAALGGAFTAPMISVQPGVSVGVIVVSFAVVIIGGLGSIEGAAVGALIVGLARSLAVHVAPVAELFSIYIVMAVVLMFRPEGLFQRTQA